MAAIALHTVRGLLALVAVMICGAAVAHGDGEPHVQFRASWSTTMQPEVHLLLTNPTATDLPFTVFFGPGETGVKCHGKLVSGDAAIDQRLRRFDTFFPMRSSGVLPAGKWAHRMFIVGSDGSFGPCEVPYKVEFESSEPSTISGTIFVPRSPAVSVSEMDVPDRWATAESMVESTIFEGEFVVYVLVRSVAERTLSVSITDRRVQCSDRGAGKVRLHDAPPEGTSVGPTWIEPGGWGVFVSAIETGGDECDMKVEISAAPAHGARPSKPIHLTFPIVATGKLSIQ